MALEYVCDRCGEVNPIETVFCVNCHAYLDLAPRIRVRATAPEPGRNPASATRHSVPTDSTEGLFRITAAQREVAVPATGEPAVLSLRIRNTSVWLGCC
jgi:ribosomal protein L40E